MFNERKREFYSLVKQTGKYRIQPFELLSNSDINENIAPLQKQLLLMFYSVRFLSSRRNFRVT